MVSGVNYSRMVGDLVRAVASPNLKVQSSSVPQINALVMRILKNLSQLLNQTRDGGATTRRRSTRLSDCRHREFASVISDGIAAPPSLPGGIWHGCR